MKTWCRAATCAMLLSTASLHAADEPANDLVIRNGRVLDGQGNP